MTEEELMYHLQCIFKKGERYDPANYHPVSLTCVVSKIMEHILASQLMRYAESSGIIMENQHNFIQQRGWETQLIELISGNCSTLDIGDEDCVLDFAKAFDKVNHHKLVTKLENYGVSFQVCAWVKQFLSNRTQQVI